jgi:hypothetical protein
VEKYWIPVRPVSLLRPGVDIVILPRHDAVEEFFQFCVTALRLKRWQVLWTSGKSFLLDKDIKRELLPSLEKIATAGSVTLVPYSVTSRFLEWGNDISHFVIGDGKEWAKKFGGKAILHPPAKGKKGLTLPAQLLEVSVPRGYFCKSTEDLLEAYFQLKQAGVKDVMIKPIKGSMGSGIEILWDLNNLFNYSFPNGPVVLEEMVHADRDPAGNVVSSSVQYMGDQLFPGVTDQILQGLTHTGDRLPSMASPAFQAELYEAAVRVHKWLGPQGPGGLDFLSVDGHPLLIDPNLGSFTETHPFRIFHQRYSPAACGKGIKIFPSASQSIDDLWSKLEGKGIAFHPGKDENGVFPLGYLKGWIGMLAVFAKTHKQVERLHKKALECL